MSQVSRECGKFGVPMIGIRCQTNSGRPRSTVTKSMHMTIAATEHNSPIKTTSRIGPQL